MKKRIRTRPCLLAVGATTASLIAGCGGNDQGKWAAAPGTQGHINLDAVKEAFQKNPRYDDFEKRVNEIFEGDRLVIFEAKSVSGGFNYTAKEDLDGDKKMSPADDTLFTLLVANGTATLKGAGVNSYYSQSQVVANTAFTSRMASRYGAGFRKSPTTARKTYISKNRGLASTRTSSSTARSGAGATSRTTSRSSSSRSSASRSRGGFGGFRGSSGFGV